MFRSDFQFPLSKVFWYAFAETPNQSVKSFTAFAFFQSVFVLSEHPLLCTSPLSNFWPVVGVAFSSGVVQQKVLGIIPSSTAGGAQTFTAFQPRTTAALSIRPGTPTSQQQVQLLVLKLVLVLVLVPSRFHSLICSAGPSRRRTNSPWHDSDPNTDPANGSNGEDHTKDTPSGPAR